MGTLARMLAYILVIILFKQNIALSCDMSCVLQVSHRLCVSCVGPNFKIYHNFTILRYLMPIVKVYRNPHPYRHCVNANAVSVLTCCLQFICYFSGSFQPLIPIAVCRACSFPYRHTLPSNKSTSFSVTESRCIHIRCDALRVAALHELG